ncbi:hypothetical protein [Candidatus Cyanaurora vandensis]|nr:hypothetical protein [Candidatus Cyanaurora vandensis]
MLEREHGVGLIYRFTDRDWDVTLSFLLALGGCVTTVRLLYLGLLTVEDLGQGVGWWLFSFFSWGYWGWLAVAVLWVLLVRYLLPAGGTLAPAVAMVYAAVILAFMFHTSWVGSAVVVGLGSVGTGLLLPVGPRWLGWSVWGGMVLLLALVGVRLWS